MLNGKKILLCVCGGIAIYKCVELASLLTKAGATVKTIMTPAAMEFVTPLTFQSITKETVSYKLFSEGAPIYHISLADWADLIVVAPATANTISKIAYGIADNLLTTTVMAAKCPKLIVPAMNNNMYESLIMQENLQRLNLLGYLVMDTETGRLACGTIGKGRMPAPQEILYAISSALHYKLDLKDRRILVTAGASVEHIDPVRAITNISSGKMGIALCRAASLRGADVTLIHSRLEVDIPYYIEAFSANSAKSMYDAVIHNYHDFDIIIMCAAVADYTPAKPAEQKIKKAGDITLELTRTKDILSELGQKRQPEQYLIGFAAESHNLKENAKEKLKKKNLDMIVANHVSIAGKSEGEIMIFKKDTPKQSQYKGDKFFLANQILSEIVL